MLDTIAAIATPLMSAALGVVRVSGPQAVDIAAALFTPKPSPTLDSAARRLQDVPTRQMVLGDLHNAKGQRIDVCLAAVYRAPNSYTGEDTVEFFCHGSLPVLKATLEGLYAGGARPAGPGEFTKRAFLHGRMDLTQAESVIDLITARTEEAARNAAGQMDGVITRRIQSVYDELSDHTAQFFAAVDYPDDDIPPVSAEILTRALSRLSNDLRALGATFSRGQLLREGVSTAIIGRPNVGKSSLLNALLGIERAIVSQTPGTTRDTLEASIQMGGVCLNLIDTAGLRGQTDDDIEAQGMKRTRDCAQNAGLMFVVVDLSSEEAPEDLEILALAQGKPCVLVGNKMDLCDNPEEAARRWMAAVADGTTASEEWGVPPMVCLSARTGAGLSDLERAVRALLDTDAMTCDGSVLTHLYQAEAVERAAAQLETAQKRLTEGHRFDAVILDIEVAMEALGELTGRSLPEDIIQRIFSRFCVGK